ncbi:MAG: SDR family oxidoreductase [Bacteroidota bacterium]|nr:SDR family oxidoreductase [Bacteroidota bacterium]
MGSLHILVTGSAGFLGSNIVRLFQARGLQVTGTWHETPPEAREGTRWLRFDLRKGLSWYDAPRERIRAVIHCAAIASVEMCEREKELARAVNVEATRMLADWCADRGIDFIFISTDLVFDGTKGWYTEEDPVSPASWYAETKALAEEAARLHHPRSWIIRPSLCYGISRGSPGSFLSWTIGRLSRGETVDFYTNQYRTPVFAEDVAETARRILERRPPPGIYHAGGPERLTRYDIALLAARIFLGSTRGIRPALLERPSIPGGFDDTSLDTAKARRDLEMNFTPLVMGFESVRSMTAAAPCGPQNETFHDGESSHG